MVSLYQENFDINLNRAIKNCTYGKSKHERKELYNQNHTFWRRLHFKWLMTPDKCLRTSGTESPVHENECYFITTYWTY